jgi:hypothetical protein
MNGEENIFCPDLMPLGGTVTIAEVWDRRTVGLPILFSESASQFAARQGHASYASVAYTYCSVGRIHDLCRPWHNEHAAICVTPHAIDL